MKLEEQLTVRHTQPLLVSYCVISACVGVCAILKSNDSHNAAAAAKLLQSCPTVRPHRWKPTKLPRPWDSPGKNTGVGCHFLLQCMKVKSENKVAQSCPTLCDPIDGSPPSSPVPGILQARTLEWVAISFSRIAEQSSDQISRSVVSDSLRSHESQHARPPCPSPTPGVHSDSCPSSQ